MRTVGLLAAIVAFAAAVADAQQLIVTPDDKTGIYATGKTVGWTIAVAEGQRASPGAYTYVVKENGGPSIKTGSLDLAKGPARIETSLTRPGMLRVELRAPAGTMQFGDVHTGGNGVVVLGAAVDPTKIQPVARPGDFDAFWDAKLKLLDAIPPKPVITAKSSGNDSIEYSTIRLDNIGGAHVYALLRGDPVPVRQK